MTPARTAAAAAAALLLGFSPFQAEERNVREGNERLSAGDAAGALSRYDAAQRAVGPRPEIDLDRGDALYRAGRAAEAREAWGRAGKTGPDGLASRAQQNLGTALAAAGDREGAIAALTQALRRDPANEDARFDLEVLLRRKQAEAEAARQRGQQAERAPPAGRSSPGTDPSGGPPPGAGAPEQRAEGGAEPAEAPRAAGPGPARPREERGPEAGEALSQESAERILDAFRSRERSSPALRAERREGRRPDADRDW